MLHAILSYKFYVGSNSLVKKHTMKMQMLGASYF